MATQAPPLIASSSIEDLQHAELMAWANWLAEGVVGIGKARIGVPGLTYILLMVLPLIESFPVILRNRCVGKFQLLPYSSMLCGGICWTAYAMLGGSYSFFLISWFQMAIGFLYCVVFWHFCPEDADWLPGTFRLHFRAIFFAVFWILAGVTTSTPAHMKSMFGIMGNVSAIIMYGSPLLAIRTVIEEKSTRSLPFGFTCATTLNAVAWCVYTAGLLQDPFLFIAPALALSLGFVQLTLFACYGCAERVEHGKSQPNYKQAQAYDKEQDLADVGRVPPNTVGSKSSEMMQDDPACEVFL